jgi:hypothetical protein
MKKILFLLVMLAGITASATVTVTPISVDYTNKKVTFKVAWTSAAANDRVWVWVDLCPVAGTTPGTFAKAVISAATATAGSITTVTGNTRGFYVNANPSTVTATLSNATGKFNWCAYGSDFPPNAVETSGTYTLKGSSPFIITTAAGTAEVSAKTYTGGTITAITDATGCPGVLCGKNGESAGLLNCCVTGTVDCGGYCMPACSNQPGCAGCAALANGQYLYGMIGSKADHCYMCVSQPDPVTLEWIECQQWAWNGKWWVMLKTSDFGWDCMKGACVYCN